jgi:hypothetical protein
MPLNCSSDALLLNQSALQDAGQSKEIINIQLKHFIHLIKLVLTDPSNPHTALHILTFFGSMHTGHIPCNPGHIWYLTLTAYYLDGIPKMLRNLRAGNSAARHGREEAGNCEHVSGGI